MNMILIEIKWEDAFVGFIKKKKTKLNTDLFIYKISKYICILPLDI